MFKKLIERIDSVNDYINPIIVRDMRSEFGKWQFSIAVMILMCLLVVACLLIYFFSDLDSLASDIDKSVANFVFWKTTANDITGLIVFFCVFSACVSIFGAFAYFVKNLTDEMFLMTAITPRQYLHAYMIETFIFTSLCMSLIAPMILIISGHVSNCIALVAIMVCDSVLFSQVGILIALSFVARTKRPNQTGNLVCGVYLGLFIFLLPWFLLAFVWINSFMWHAIDMNNIFGIVSIYVLLPIGLLLTGVMGYKLSLYGFKTRGKSLIRMFFLNIFCYTLLNAVMALIYFCIAFVVFTFL
ncbi:MAG: hypothetical protein LBL39_00775 [Planctomycetaceae bacterium]|jgi:hypothetical protein|nr:hypothetical protein [Planctomycetaceae bacterium]